MFAYLFAAAGLCFAVYQHRKTAELKRRVIGLKRLNDERDGLYKELESCDDIAAPKPRRQSEK